jgi:hypothetical protein
MYIDKRLLEILETHKGETTDVNLMISLIKTTAEEYKILKMKNKTKVKVIQTPREGQHKKGDIGYIDGYVLAADGKPYAVVVCESIIDFVPIWSLEVIKSSDKPVDGGTSY